MNDRVIWQNFENHYQLNQEIQVKDIPSLKLLISEIFIEKEIQLSV
jgi:hypothetical protein